MSPEVLSTTKLNLYRALADDLRGDRLAIDVLLATVGGDSLPEAIARLEMVLEDLPPRKDGRRYEHRVWNDLVTRSKEMLELAIHDLRKLEEHLGGETEPATVT